MIEISAATVITALLAGAIYALGAIFIGLRRGIDSISARLAIVYLSLSFLWSAGMALERGGFFALGEDAPLVEPAAFGLLVMSILFFCLTRSMMSPHGEWWTWVVLGAGWLTLVVVVQLLGWLFVDLLTLGMSWQTGLSILDKALLISGWGIFMGGAVYLTVKKLRRLPLFNDEVIYWLAPLFLVVMGDGLLWTGFQAGGDILRGMGGLAVGLLIGSPHLPDIDENSRRRLDLGLTGGLSIALNLLVVIAAGFAARRWPDTGLFWIALFGAVILALLVRPLLKFVHTSIRMRPANSQEALTNLLRQYSQSITNTLDINLLATVAVGTASELLEIRRGYLFLVETEKEADGSETVVLRGVKGMGDFEPAPCRFHSETSLIQFFRSEARPIPYDQLIKLPGFQPYGLDRSGGSEELSPVLNGERAWLSGLGVEVFVPIQSHNQWIGLLALGPKSSPKPYTSQELAFLSALAGQTAVALENARLVEGLIKLNEEFRNAYQALDQANHHLERLDKAKSDFLSIVTHELRTPINLISSASQMLLDEPELQENPYYQEVLTNLRAGIQRQDKIIESMLDMARIDTRLMKLELQPVPIHSLIRIIREDLIVDANQRKLTIETSGLEKLPPVMADSPALKKVFQNLLINAIKYTPDGGRITVRGRTIFPDGKDLPQGGIEVVVSDTGIGIDPDYRDLVFVKFYQGGEVAQHSSGRTKFKGGGPGLGLSIARGIVEAHQGKIWVESPGYDEKKNPGSQFHVILPCRPVEKPALQEERNIHI